MFRLNPARERFFFHNRTLSRWYPVFPLRNATNREGCIYIHVCSKVIPSDSSNCTGADRAKPSTGCRLAAFSHVGEDSGTRSLRCVTSSCTAINNSRSYLATGNPYKQARIEASRAVQRIPDTSTSRIAVAAVVYHTSMLISLYYRSSCLLPPSIASVDA